MHGEPWMKLTDHKRHSLAAQGPDEKLKAGVRKIGDKISHVCGERLMLLADHKKAFACSPGTP